MKQHVSLKEIFNESAEIPQWMNYGAAGNQPISLERCVDIFNQFAARKGFDFYEDGCYNRAHVMCRSLEDEGIAPAKVWAFQDTQMIAGFEHKEALWTMVDETLNHKETWQYHVAACVPVRMPDDTVQNVVLDPTIMNGPATVQQWQEVLHALERNVEVVPFGSRTLQRSADFTPDADKKPDAITTPFTDEYAQKQVRLYGKLGISVRFVKNDSELMKVHGSSINRPPKPRTVPALG